MDDHQIAVFFEKTQETFRFLEQEYGYHHLDNFVHDRDYWRDTSAVTRYLGSRVGVKIWWYFADAGIGVTFVEIVQPGVFPALASLYPTTRQRAKAINLTSLVEMQGALDNPDFLLKEPDNYLKHTQHMKLIETRMPEIIEELLTFQNTSQEWYSDCFELAIIPETRLLSHISEETLSQFYGFGHDLSDSIYALWHYNRDAPLDKAPVVYLNAEAEGSRVLAATLLEFLVLLTYDKDPIFGEYPQVDQEVKHTGRNPEFRAWLEQCYHLQATKEPNEIVRHAQAGHPPLPLAYDPE